MIGSYLIFAVLGFILISTFTAHYNQNYLEQYYAAALRRESSQMQILSETATIDLS